LDVYVWIIVSKPFSRAFKNGLPQFFKLSKHNVYSIRGTNFIPLTLIARYNLISKKS
jgi:hypothetical protein